MLRTSWRFYLMGFLQSRSASAEADAYLYDVGLKRHPEDRNCVGMNSAGAGLIGFVS